MAEIFNFSTFGKRKEKELQKFEQQKNSKRQIDLRYRYSLSHFWENSKSSKLKFSDSYLPKTMFFRSCNFIFIFFALFWKKCTSVYRYMYISGHIDFYEILWSSNYFSWTSPNWWSRGSPGGWIKMSFFKTFW